MAKKQNKDKKTKTLNEVATREYTIHIHRRIHGIGFKSLEEVDTECWMLNFYFTWKNIEQINQKGNQY